MRVKLMNSSMMPHEGIYVTKKITKDRFCEELKKAYTNGILDSYIGYPNNVKLIKEWTGINVPLSRDTTILEDGDVMIVMKLKGRLPDPNMKGSTTFAEEDFEFFYVQYKKFM
ncbi:MAG: DUF1874 domain-containing protein [Candidatus Jordarchaeaceae archaeon]